MGSARLDVLGLVPERATSCPGHRRPLRIDSACLSVVNRLTDKDISVFMQSSECYQCDLMPFGSVAAGDSSTSYVVNTTYSTSVAIHTAAGNSTQLCRRQVEFGEFGWYQLSVDRSAQHGDDSVSCLLDTLSPPSSVYLPWLYVLLSLSLLWLFVRGCSVLHARGLFRRLARSIGAHSLLVTDLGDPDHSSLVAAVGDMYDIHAVDRTSTNRVHSLDVFRGLCILLMIFVNYGGGNYWLFRHSAWNGLTVADLVFPWFMWIMGVSLYLSMRSQIRRSSPKSQVILRMLRRCALLFVFGLAVNSLAARASYTAVTATTDDDDVHRNCLSPMAAANADDDDVHRNCLSSNTGRLRIPGVLQRLAVCSLIVMAIVLPTLQPDDGYQTIRYSVVHELTDVWGQWCIIGVLIIIHTAITFLLPVPNCPRGYLGAGGWSEGGRYVNCTGGAAGYIDRYVFGSWMHQSPTSRRVYNSAVAYDPEGILGVLTSCVVVFFGCVAGRIIIVYPVWKQRVRHFLYWALCLSLLGGSLCCFSLQQGPVPLNKNLWSLSYSLTTGGLAFLLFALLYMLVDVFVVWHGLPFYYAGLNAIVLYMGHEVCAHVFPVSLERLTGWRHPSTHLASLYVNVWSTLVWVFFSWLLYCRRLFVSL